MNELLASCLRNEAPLIESDEISDCTSRWGNTFSCITEENIDELRNGKVIFIDDGEYCHFIALKT